MKNLEKKYIKLLQLQEKIKEKIKELKPKVIGKTKQEGTFIEDESAWENQVGNIFLRVKTCQGRNSFQQKVAQKKFPELKTALYYKRGKPFDHLTYDVLIDQKGVTK